MLIIKKLAQAVIRRWQIWLLLALKHLIKILKKPMRKAVRRWIDRFLDWFQIFASAVTIADFILRILP